MRPAVECVRSLGFSLEGDGQLLDGDGIKELLEGNSTDGFMMSSGTYREYYERGGTLLTRTGQTKWWIMGNTFCSVYPGEKDYCLSVRKLSNGAIAWELDGRAVGYGRVLSGIHESLRGSPP